ncbi:MAG: mannonate dehydratase [Candidatus Latescibacteria bacterium]|jgi:mannonate dehydratase|nr:mannonate dehydratase [Gemmatimonadaceae bacterium]MDP7447753.1 mannonate dehydratase [Candidatus Latescibacterota bacterium]HJP31239.1 mannonate dehydratase [Candidatus Latescibacterota bacterium]
MRIGLVLQPFSEQSLQLAAQLGATDVVAGMPTGDFESLIRLKSRVEDAGLSLSVIEGLMAIDEVVLGVDGRDECIKTFQQGLRQMGAAGIPTLCYNFMVWRPGVGVVRTSYTTRERGGSWVSSFDADLLAQAPEIPGASIEAEQVWDNLEYFLKAVIPVAEDAGVKLAMHPDDPPMSLRGQARIMSTPDNFDRLVNLVKSPSNGLTFCQGCFAEMGADIPAAIRRFADNIHFVHFRDVQGQVPKFSESWHDNGKTNMLSAMKTYAEIGFAGVMRPDHAPFMYGAGDEGEPTGYELTGKIFAVGYMQGLREAALAG